MSTHNIHFLREIRNKNILSSRKKKKVNYQASKSWMDEWNLTISCTCPWASNKI